MHRTVILLLVSITPSFGAACFAVASGSWNSAATWGSSAVAAGGTCAAAGGAGATIRGTVSTVITAGVPGAVGQTDTVTINTGITVNIPAGVHPDIGNIGASTVSITLNATNSTTYGYLRIDDGGAMSSRGTGNLALINRYAVVQVMPGGAWYVDASAQNSGNFLYDQGRLYIGCGTEETTTAACTAITNPGSYATSNSGTPGTFTMANTITGLAVGDLVTIDTLPVHPTVVPPTSGVTAALATAAAPSALPRMPKTADGRLPNGWLMCVTAIASTTLSVGFPDASYGCGSATSLAFTAAGSGSVYIKKPAIYGVAWTRIGWGNQATAQAHRAPDAGAFNFDTTRTMIQLASAPVSNVAGNGAGRKGDTSFSVGSYSIYSGTGAGSCTQGSPCTSGLFVTRKDDWQDIAAKGDWWMDEDQGLILFWMPNGTVSSFASTYKYVQISSNCPQMPTNDGNTSHNELIIQNSYIQIARANDTARGAFTVMQMKSAAVDATRRFAFRKNTVRLSANVIHFGSTTASTGSASPSTDNGNLERPNSIKIVDNAIFQPFSRNMGFIGGAFPANYVDFSHNYLNHNATVVYLDPSGGGATQYAFSNWTILNNAGGSGALLRTSVRAVTVPGMLVQNNRLISSVYVDRIMNEPHGTVASPAVIEWNYFYGANRLGTLAGGSEWHHNYFAHCWHHGFTAPWGGQTYQEAMSIHHNILVGLNAEGIGTGYLEFALNDSQYIYNNTILGAALGCIGRGDVGDNQTSLSVDQRVWNNLCIPGTINAAAVVPFGIGKWIATVGANATKNVVRTHTPLTENNLYYGAYQNYKGYAASAGTYVLGDTTYTYLAQYNKDARFEQSGVRYGTNASKNVKGVAPWNPSYTTCSTRGCTLATGALKLIVTDSTHATLQWSADNGSSYGTAVELVFLNKTYTLSAAANGASALDKYALLTVTGDTFNLDAKNSTLVPAGKWLRPLTGVWVSGPCLAADSRTHWPITYEVSTFTNVQIRVPRLPTACIPLATETFAIVESEIRLFDAGGTNYVDVGIDARSLPTVAGTYIDTDIAVKITDFTDVNPGLASTANTSTTWDKIADPSQASAQTAFALSDYRPTVASVCTGATDGGAIGAVACASGVTAYPGAHFQQNAVQ